MKHILCIMTVMALVVAAQDAPKIPKGWFPFTVDARVLSSENLASVGFLNPSKATERIIVKDGHFTTVSGDSVRFFGSNLCYDNAFPDKELAPRIAGRMKQLGFNVIRFHHLDNRHIVNKDRTALNPVMLDKLHWLMFQLRENGIYSNLNLHVSRVYKGLGDLGKTFKYGKGLDRFYPPFVESQKKYAKELLTTVNPYTNLAPIDDPMIAFVEINNENSISQLDNIDNLDLLRNHEIGAELLRQWRLWLSRKYRTFDDLKTSWSNGLQPYSPVNLIENTAIVAEGKKDGFFEITKVGPLDYDCKLLQDGSTAWAYQIHFPDVPLKENQNYTIKFKARATVNRSINVNLGLHEPPWFVYSRSRVKLTPEWQEFKLIATIQNYMPDKRTRFTFNLGGLNAGLELQLKDIELHEGNEPYDYKEQQNFDTVELPEVTSTAFCRRDFREFLIETEYNFTKNMVAYLKNELGLKALVIDTQATYTGAYGMIREGELCDYVDAHAYWEHPHFAEGHSWSPLHWTIPNTPMASSANGGTFQNLIRARIAGKPFTVSEYDHPAPNEHNAEMFPMLGSFSAFQDWDAIYQFSYASPWNDAMPSRLNGYFAMAVNPGKMVMAPFAAMMFRGRLVDTATTTTTISVPKELLFSVLPSKIPDMSAGSLPGYPRNAIGNTIIQTSLTSNGLQTSCDASDRLSGLPLKTQQIEWTIDENQHGVYLVNAPSVRAATGFIGNRDIALGDMRFNMTLPEKDTAAIAITALDGRPLAKSKKLLLAVVGKIANVGMQWNEERTTVKDKWGQPPSIAPFIPFTITLPGDAKPTVKALDGAGKPMGELSVEHKPEGWSFSARKDRPSLWFAIER
ncbi:MAG: carbohydrate binding domain-containing protein [Victivallales bacterium]|nr:carbohydrate binding domain-containing protein [Victivallales bacterium]